MQTVFFWFDDSGVLHRNEESGYFVYAGYVFCSRNEMGEASRKYIHANKKIKEALGRTDELKACNTETKHKRSLFNSMRGYETASVIVNVKRVYGSILDNKNSICRYKDYALKRCIKEKLKELIDKGKLSSDEDIEIHIFIDQQLTATNGYYKLSDSIKEELQYGIANFDYGIRHSNIFNAEVKVCIKYCDSKKYYLIQACDILANRIWTSYRKDDKRLRKIANHTSLTLP